MRSFIGRSCAVAMLAGLLVLGDAASGLPGTSEPLVSSVPEARPIPLPSAGSERVPDARDEVTLDGYGVQVARVARFLPRSLLRRSSQPEMALLMRHGDLLDALVEAPVLRLAGSATLPTPALRAPEDGVGVGGAFGTSPILSRTMLVPESGTGAFLSLGLLALAVGRRASRPIEPEPS